MRKGTATVRPSKPDPLSIFPLVWVQDTSRGKAYLERLGIVQTRSGSNDKFHLASLMGLNLSLSLIPFSRRLFRLPVGNCLRSHPPAARCEHPLLQQMHGLMTIRRVQNGLVRNLTRRTAHSGLPESILRQLPTRTYHLSFSGPFPQRTHNCGALSEHDVGSNVVLSGWLLPERSPLPSSRWPSPVFIRLIHRKITKSLSFFPLKDSYGTTQLVIRHDPTNVDKFAALSATPPESVVLIQGSVGSRPDCSKRPVSFYLSYSKDIPLSNLSVHRAQQGQ